MYIWGCILMRGRADYWFKQPRRLFCPLLGNHSRSGLGLASSPPSYISPSAPISSGHSAGGFRLPISDINSTKRRRAPEGLPTHRPAGWGTRRRSRLGNVQCRAGLGCPDPARGCPRRPAGFCRPVGEGSPKPHGAPGCPQERFGSLGGEIRHCTVVGTHGAGFYHSAAQAVTR